MKNIEILDRSFRRLAFIDNDLEEGIHFTDDSLETSIETGVYTLDMEIPKDTPLTRHITYGNYITFLNRQDRRILLTIMKVEEDGHYLNMYCEDTSINLINKVVGKFDLPNRELGIEEYLNVWLKDTGWEIGKNESKNKIKKEYTGNETLLKRIQTITADFGVEFYFEVLMEGGQNPDFQLHIVEKRIGDDEGFRVSTDAQLDGIKREMNLDNVVTKLIVRGAEIKEGVDKKETSETELVENTMKQLNTSNFDSSKRSGATAISTTGWDETWVNNFKMNQADPPYVNGDYIDTFLKTYYSDSPLIGHGQTIKEMSDYFGVSVGAAIGVWAKETTFGRGHPGKVDHNYGCIRWTSGSGYPAVTYAGSKWNKYPNVKTGLAAWFKLVRWEYIEKGYVTYKDFLNRYSPSFENNQATFKNIMWGALKSFGYQTPDSTVKSNYSNKNDNPTTLSLSGDKKINNTSTAVTTKHNSMLEKMIKWFSDRQGKVSYSMKYRGGPNSYDCSSAMYSALFYAGFKPNINYLGSTVSLWNDVGAGKLIQEIPRNQARRGDIFLSGAKGAASAGASGHTGVFLSNSQIIHCNYRDNGITTTAVEGRAGSPLYCFRINDKTSGEVISTEASSTKTENAVKLALSKVGRPYVYGAVGPNSFDCSGLVIWAYKAAGFTINHRATTYTIAQQKSPFKKISASEAKRGDLVICVNGGHVAILLGTPSSGAGVVHAATPELGVITQKSLMGPIGYYRVT